MSGCLGFGDRLLSALLAVVAMMLLDYVMKIHCTVYLSFLFFILAAPIQIAAPLD